MISLNKSLTFIRVDCRMCVSQLCLCMYKYLMFCSGNTKVHLPNSFVQKMSRSFVYDLTLYSKRIPCVLKEQSSGIQREAKRKLGFKLCLPTELTVVD